MNENSISRIKLPRKVNRNKTLFKVILLQNSQRKKQFYEIAAEQSGVVQSNFEIPNSLMTSLVTFSSSCAVANMIYSKFNWREFAIVLQKKLNTKAKTKKKGRSKIKNLSNGYVCGAKCQPRNKPTTTPVLLENKNSEVETKARKNKILDMENQVFEAVNKRMSWSEAKLYVRDIHELIDYVKQCRHLGNSRPVGWSDKVKAKIAGDRLVVVLSYLPKLITIDEVVNICLAPHGVLVLEKVLIEMPELAYAITDKLVNGKFRPFAVGYRTQLIRKVGAIYPKFRRQIVYELVENRNDCNFGCRLAVEVLTDTEFIEFLEPELVNKESILNEVALRSSGQNIRELFIRRLIHMTEKVLSCTPRIMTEIARAPWCTRLAYCIVELLNEKWKESDIKTVTKFIFRTRINQLSKNIKNVASSSSTKMDTNDFSMMNFNNSYSDSVVEDSQETQSTKNIAERQKKKTEINVEPSPFGNAHESFVLAALVAIPIFTQYPTNHTSAVQPPDPCVETWLDHARRRTFGWVKTAGCFSLDLLFVHSCIMSGRMDALFSFANEVLKQKADISKKMTHSQVLQNAFLTRCLSELEVAKRSVVLPVTSNLNQNTSGRSAIHSISALQSAGVYKTFKISIAEWLERQLRSVSFPMSEILSEMCETFGSNVASAQTGGLSEKFVSETFSGDIADENMLPRRLYVLLYLVSYREQSHRIVRSASFKQLYEESVYTKLPVRYLMTVVETRYADFEHIRCRLIAKCGNLYPYMMPTAKSLSFIKKRCSTTENLPKLKDSSLEQNLRKIQNESVSLHFLESVRRTTLRNQISAIPLVLECFMQSLNGDFSSTIEQMIVTLFDWYEQICPRLLFESASLVWLRHDSDLRVEDLYKIPALLFRVDKRILNSPPHFACFIRCLNFFSVVVRTDLRLKMQLADTKQFSANQHHRPTNDIEKKERDHLTIAYIDSQHSVLIHGLIEVCDSVRMKDDPTDYALIERRQLICKIACKYMHRAFIDYEGLMRVVLYQKFPIRLIRTLVDEIPSLFAANASILEMLSLPDYQRRIFAIVLASEICRKYRVRESLETARVVCDVVHSLHKYGELPSSNRVWKHITPALVLLATEFPSLTDSITRLLNRVVANANNRLAVRFGMLSGDPKHEEFLLISTINSFLNRDKKLIDGIVSQNSL